MRYTPKSETDLRIAHLQESLRAHDIDGAVIVQNADLFYFTGTIQRAHLFIPAQGQPLLMVKKELGRAQAESPLSVIIGLDSLRNLTAILRQYGYGDFQTLGFELDVLSAKQYFSYQKLFAPAQIVDIGFLIREVRMRKTPYEIEILRDLGELHRQTFSLVRDTVRAGVSELEVTGAVAAFSRQKGHSGYLRVRGFNQDFFYAHLVSGVNFKPSYFDGSAGGEGVGPAFAQGASTKLIAKNEPVLFDYSFVLDGYLLDQTRIFSVDDLPRHLTEAHATAIHILDEIKKIARPGLPCGELYALSRRLAEESGFGPHYLGFPDYLTFVGHGVGIELDELPLIAQGVQMPLEEGMVFALEPKFVFPEGVVGLENTYLVTKDGLENLTVFDENIIQC